MTVSILEWHTAPGGQAFMILWLDAENGRGRCRAFRERILKVVWGQQTSAALTLALTPCHSSMQALASSPS